MPVRERWSGPTCRRPSACTAQPLSCASWASCCTWTPSLSSSARSTPPSSRIWDLWRSVTQDFFGTANFAVVANETYTRGMRHFLEDELGLPCNFAYARKAWRKDRQRHSPQAHAREAAAGDVRQLQRTHVPERDWARWPRPARRRTSRRRSRARSSAATPARRSWAMPAPPIIVQEFCNALFDALFHILPLGTELDKVDATPSRLLASRTCPWDATRPAGAAQERIGRSAAGAGADLGRQADCATRRARVPATLAKSGHAAARDGLKRA